MQKGILAGRLQMARERIIKAAEAGVSETAVGPLLLSGLYAAQREKNPDVRALYELEAVGPIVEALVEQVEALVEQLDAVADVGTPTEGTLDQAAILAIPGLTKTSREAITAYFEEMNANPN